MQALKVIALLSMPLVTWMFLVSEPLILLLLGEKWVGVVPIFQVLAMVAFIQPSLGAVGPLLLSLGRSRDYLWLGTANALIYSAGFAIGVQFGAQGIAYSFVVSTYIVLVPSYIFTYWGTNVRIIDFFRSIAFPTVGSLAATSITLALLSIPTLSSVLDRSIWLDIIGRSTLFFFLFCSLLVLTESGKMILRDLRKIVIQRDDELSSN
jgi:PST family polysaccharide transporter